MPRKGPVQKRDVIPDPIYSSKMVNRLINKVMYDGKKAKAQNICYRAIEIVQNKSGKPGIEAFEQALRNIMPVLEVKPRRVGGATYQVPVEVAPDRRRALAMRWLLTYSRQRKEQTMEERLAGEILDAFQGVGNSVKKREDTHKMAEANKAFAHFRW
ncbi:MAG: 30S ribosomal protein S7 [Firmicutes bacterium]|nr:30S ribosomal protein S7 [Bacillota bacterium]